MPTTSERRQRRFRSAKKTPALGLPTLVNRRFSYVRRTPAPGSPAGETAVLRAQGGNGSVALCPRGNEYSQPGERGPASPIFWLDLAIYSGSVTSASRALKNRFHIQELCVLASGRSGR